MKLTTRTLSAWWSVLCRRLQKVSNIGGGGEFGTRSHEAGRREGKRLSHDAFAAVAADLVGRGVARPERIAVEGCSNGGLLIANMLFRCPERFGAKFCIIPLIDMRRFNRLLVGASWIAEYGHPDNPVGFPAAPLGLPAAVPGQRYPPILLATTRRNDRVQPGHARRLAAKLQAMGIRRCSMSRLPVVAAMARAVPRQRASQTFALHSCAMPSAGRQRRADPPRAAALEPVRRR